MDGYRRLLFSQVVKFDYFPTQCSQLFQKEKVLTFERLLKLLESSEVTVLLRASQTNSALLEIVRETAAKCPIFTKRIIFCCASPTAIYQVSWTEHYIWSNTAGSGTNLIPLPASSTMSGSGVRFVDGKVLLYDTATLSEYLDHPAIHCRCHLSKHHSTGDRC